MFKCPVIALKVINLNELPTAVKSGHPAKNMPQAYLWQPKFLVEVQHVKRHLAKY